MLGQHHPSIDALHQSQWGACPFLKKLLAQDAPDGSSGSGAVSACPVDARVESPASSPSAYDDHFKRCVRDIKEEGRYRVFTDIQRHARHFPTASWFDAHSMKNGEPKEVTVWCSNDYLGLAQHPTVMRAVKTAVDIYGTGSGGTRNIGGNTHAHVELEQTIAQWQKKDRALVFTSGYVANEATLSSLALILPKVIFFSDEENHNSMIRGMITAKGASKKIFRHNDTEHLKELLREARMRHPDASLVVAFESVYSMSGTIAPIAKIVEVAKEFGALTFIDEVHAVGMYGPTGAGVAERDNILSEIDIVQGTLGKAVGNHGGFISSTHDIIDAVRSVAAGFIFTTSIPPHVAAGARQSIEVITGVEGAELRSRQHSRVAQVKQRLRDEGLPLLEGPSHIVPLLVMDSQLCKAASDILLSRHGIYVQPINFPTVDKGRERLRITPGPVHTDAHVDALVTAVCDTWKHLKLPLHHHTAALGDDKATCPVMQHRAMLSTEKIVFQKSFHSALLNTVASAHSNLASAATSDTPTAPSAASETASEAPPAAAKGKCPFLHPPAATPKAVDGAAATVKSDS